MLQNGPLPFNKQRSILLDHLVVHTDNKMSFKVDEYSTVVAFPLQSLTQGANNLFDTSGQRHTERIYSIYIFFFFSISLYFHTSTQPRPPGQLCQLILNCLEDDWKGHSCRLLRAPPPSSTPPSEGRETATLADVAFIPLKCCEASATASNSSRRFSCFPP